ncbi:MAG: hypothetical protein WD270_03105 [Acetobacterales bacterium]
MASVMIETDFFGAELPAVEPAALRGMRATRPASLHCDSGIEAYAAPGDLIDAMMRDDEGVFAAFA